MLSILIPSDALCSTRFTLSLATLTSDLTAMGVPYEISNEQSSILLQSRHRLIKWALDRGAEYALTLDSDMIFPVYTYRKLKAADKDVVCCNYTTRKFPIRPTLHINRKYIDSRYRSGLEQVDNLTMGVCLIKLSAIRNIEFPHYQFTWQGSDRDDPYSGEDYYFAAKLKEANIPIYCDHDLSKVILHDGSYAYGWNSMAPNDTEVPPPEQKEEEATN